MVLELKDFVNNWEINVIAESAKHISGLSFRHIPKGSDGEEKIEVSDLPLWTRDFMNKGNTIDQCKKMQAQLYNEFKCIYQNVIIPKKHILQK